MIRVSCFLGFCMLLHLDLAGRSTAARTAEGATVAALLETAAASKLEAKEGSHAAAAAPSLRALLTHAGFVLAELLHRPPAAAGFTLGFNILQLVRPDAWPEDSEAPARKPRIYEDFERERMDRGGWEEDHMTLADQSMWHGMGLDLLPANVRARLQDVRLLGYDENNWEYRCSLDGVEVAMKLTKSRSRNILEQIATSGMNMDRFGGGDILKAGMAAREMDTGEVALLTFQEVADTNLYELIYERGLSNVSWSNRIRMAVEILRGLSKLADAGVMCRDIRPVNVAVLGDLSNANAPLHAKLADLGRSCDRQALQDSGKAHVIAGSPHYMSPEEWAGKPDFKRADTWAAGILLMELFTGSRPEAFFDEKFKRLEGAPLGEDPLRNFVMHEFDIKHDPKFQALEKAHLDVARVIRALLRHRSWRRLTIQKAFGRFLAIAEASGIDVTEQTTRFPF